MKKKYLIPIFYVLLAVLGLNSIFEKEALAFNIYGYKYDVHINNQKYWMDDEENSQQGMLIKSAVADWNETNNTGNTGVKWVLTGIKAYSIMDFTGYTYEKGVLGVTMFWRADRQVHPWNEKYEFTTILRQKDFDKYKIDSEAYNLPIAREQELVFQAMIAHEMGHAIGIAHTDFHSDTLMYADSTPWRKWGIYSPDDDAIEAAALLYGP
ncbi:matrixin family metalloprotease [Brevibacillus formosus]|uniref:matrixin family metalloprotease n=1 Tax=Brevibacillus formosus TaxID=54913 RepID=UPI003F1DA6C8